MVARLLWSLVLTGGLLASCGPSSSPVPAVPQVPVSVPVRTFSDLRPSAEEIAWRDARRAAGGALKAGTIHVTGTFEEAEDGTRSGLDWELARDFASTLGLTLEVTVPSNLATFFSRDGVIPSDVETNPAVEYTPDLLQSVDLYIGPFSVLPWRERLMTMVALYPMQNFLAGRKGEEIRSVGQLQGKRIALLKDSMQDNLLRGLATREGLDLRLQYVSPETDVFAEVLAGKADYTLDGGLFFAQNREKIQGLSLSTFPSEPVRVGWCLKKEEGALASLLVKYVAVVQADGSFGRWFEASLGTNFTDYLSLLATSLPPGSTP